MSRQWGGMSGGTFIRACVVCVLMVSLVQCSRDKQDSRKQPSREQIAQVVASEVPAYVSVRDLMLDMIPQGPGVMKVNFKATCITRGDLYVRISDSGVPQSVVKMAQKENEEFAVYGSLIAQRLVDKWDFSKFSIESGLEQLGKPKESYGTDAFVYDSAEYRAAVDKAQKERKIIQEETDKASQAKSRATEVMKAQDQAKREEIERAKEKERANEIKQARGIFFVGRLCKGTLMYRNLVQSVEVRILSGNPDACSVECINPKDGTSQMFEGRIDFAETPPRLVLKSRSSQQLPSSTWYFYSSMGNLILRRSEFGGLDGEASMGSSGYYKYTLVLRDCQ